MAVLLKDILPSIIAQQSDWRTTLLQQWNVIVGSLQTRIRLEKIYDDTLIIGVYESHWMQELYLLSGVLIDQINSFLGEQRIAHVRFKLVEEKKLVKKALRSKKLVRPATFELTAAQRQALERVPDEQLKSALIQFWGRCLS